MTAQDWSFPRAEALPPYAFVVTDAVKARVRAAGADIIDLGMGNPDRPTPHEIVARLTERGMKHLYIDGGITIQRFLEAGLIQRMTITRIPILLGSGIPLFGPLSHDIKFEHVATRSFPSGMVQSEYVIAT